MDFYSDIPYGDFYEYSYNYDLPTAPSGIESAMGSVLMGVMVFYLVLVLVVCVMALAEYILKGIGLYTIAKREGRDYPGLAFVPFARIYMQGELGGAIVLKKRQIRNPGIWMVVLPFIAAAIAMVLYFVFWISVGLKMALYFEGSYQSGFGSLTGLGVLLIAALLIFVVYGAVYKVLRILVNRQIYEKFTSPNMAVAHAVLGVLLPLYESICLFVLRNRPYNPGKEPDLGTPFMTAQDMLPPVTPEKDSAGEVEVPKPEHEQVEGNYTYENPETEEPEEGKPHEEE